jgi:hypothetical protein
VASRHPFPSKSCAASTIKGPPLPAPPCAARAAARVAAPAQTAQLPRSPSLQCGARRDRPWSTAALSFGSPAPPPPSLLNIPPSPSVPRSAPPPHPPHPRAARAMLNQGQAPGLRQPCLNTFRKRSQPLPAAALSPHRPSPPDTPFPTPSTKQDGIMCHQPHPTPAHTTHRGRALRTSAPPNAPRLPATQLTPRCATQQVLPRDRGRLYSPTHGRAGSHTAGCAGA